MNFKRIISLIALCIALTACGASPDGAVRQAPKPQNADVVNSPPAAKPETVGSCVASEGKIGRPYTIRGVRYTPKLNPNYNATGKASYYGKSHHGKMTANGETFDMNALSAAHTTLPLPTCVIVTNLRNNKSILLRVNDRGPFVKGRIIDVSYRAAQILDFVNSGLTEVRVEVVKGSAP